MIIIIVSIIITDNSSLYTYMCIPRGGNGGVMSSRESTGTHPHEGPSVWRYELPSFCPFMAMSPSSAIHTYIYIYIHIYTYICYTCF